MLAFGHRSGLSQSWVAILPAAPSWHSGTRFRAVFADPHMEGSITAKTPRPPPQAGLDPVAAPDPDDGRNARGEGKAQALARERVGQEAGQDARHAHDPGRARAGRPLLCG